MPHSFGLRARTRNMFSRAFRAHGPTNTSTYLVQFKKGDYVDIKANASIHKGMPYRYYQGKTGVVWNVTPRAIGVEINKTVGNRIIKKRLHVRVEHVQKSKCRDDFLKRCKRNAQLKKKNAEKQKKGEKVHALRGLKRKPTLPRNGALVKSRGPIITYTPLKYELLM